MTEEMTRLSNISTATETLSHPAATALGPAGDAAHAAVVRYVSIDVFLVAVKFCHVGATCLEHWVVHLVALVVVGGGGSADTIAIAIADGTSRY